MVFEPKVSTISEKIYYWSLNGFWPLKGVVKNNFSKIFGESPFEEVY